MMFYIIAECRCLWPTISISLSEQNCLVGQVGSHKFKVENYGPFTLSVNG